jgi:uncharacterized protein YcfJ
MFNQGDVMKKLLFVALFVPVVAMSQQYAEVVRVEPRMITIQQQQCQDVLVQVPGSSGNAAGGVLGALAGAAIGNQIGGGSGRDIATAAGAVIGYQAGRGEPAAPSVERRVQCHYVPVSVQRGETVTFRYNGRLFSQTFE